jgi:hypothetical protein
MNWIRKEKRLAIYLRDGLACVWCQATVEDTVRLTLDHLIAHSKGGSNNETNLVTSCLSCNSSRQDRSVEAFAKAASRYRGVPVAKVLAFIRKTTSRKLDVGAAKKLIARRGGFVNAVKGGME